MENAGWNLNWIHCKLYAITRAHPESMCYCINRNDNAIITHHSIKKQRTTAKEQSVGSFQVPVCTYKSVFTPLVCLYQKQTSVRTNVIGAYTRVYCCQEYQETPSRLLVGNGTKSTRFPIHFYTSARVLVSFMMFYDVKPQLVKSCYRG